MPVVTSSIGVAFPGFTLTGSDSIQAPFEAVVVQVREPASAVFVALGILVALIRRRALPMGGFHIIERRTTVSAPPRTSEWTDYAA